jgi:hypothetical protein
LEAASPHVREHLIEHGADLRSGLDLIVNDGLIAARGGKLLDLGHLVLDLLPVSRNPQVHRAPLGRLHGEHDAAEEPTASSP